MQREAQTGIYRNTQTRLQYLQIKEEEHQRQMRNAKAREDKKQHNDNMNFFVIDCETNGFTHNEPVEIVVLRFEDGEEKGKFKKKFMPEADFTIEARQVTGLNKKELRAQGAQPFDQKSANLLMYFLNSHPEYPIIAQWAQYDRDSVLTPAFQRVSKASMLPMTSRWRCTVGLAQHMGLAPPYKLDDLLEKLGFERRHPQNKHKAMEDCQLTAKVYMALLKLSSDVKTKLGFVKDE